ncbi:MAG TPA: ATP-binding protein, partial [Thermoplasmata archaeon]|nr:ATP-binding protein [Thermoplasmata archaeon]
MASSDSALVDRAEELRRLTAAVEAAASGRGGFLALHGEPGIGKTRLIQEAVAVARSKGFASGRGSAI